MLYTTKVATDLHIPQEHEILLYMNILYLLLKLYPLNLWHKLETKLLHKSWSYLLHIAGASRKYCSQYTNILMLCMLFSGTLVGSNNFTVRIQVHCFRFKTNVSAILAFKVHYKVKRYVYRKLMLIICLYGAPLLFMCGCFNIFYIFQGCYPNP